MPPTAAPAPSPTRPSFAGLLVDLAAPEKKFPPARAVDGLADEIATLSYEQAVRRYHPAATGLQPLPERSFPPSDLPSTAAAATAASSVQPTGATGDRKQASVTVRLTQTENDRLRARAAEAGLTVSAYLRSCAFEVESLRAQVKDTLAQLRRASLPQPFWRRLFPRRPQTN